MKELDKAYNPSKYEDEIYSAWEKSGFFNPDNLEGEPFSIMMPPPNVTGVLHLGHALENSLMDVMLRYQRMNGKKALLVPGTDHAAVATQAKVEKLLVESGDFKNPREELGREGLLEKIREFAEDSKSTILSQVKKMGTSCDWSRLAYTFDDERNQVVNEVFKKMYDDGLIYRGHRVVNWSVKGQSTCSDDELEYKERQGKLYTFTYGPECPIVIATTRPETKLGDTAIAVHPEGRWKDYIGQEFEIKNFGQDGHSLKLKVIGDAHVDDSYGTGALGVTTAHSAIDFDMYLDQKAKGNDIGLIQVIDKNGKLTAATGSEYKGLSVEEARTKVVAWLNESGLMQKEEDITQNVGTSDRFKDIVEALPMTQWFVDVNKKIPGKGKSLKQLMKEAVSVGHNGDKNQKINITPDRFENIYYNWIDNLRDWCISRQIWWGHRIPVWYKGTEVYCGTEAPEGDEWIQDEDTLDTWFSSGTWTFSALGYGQEKNDMETFHPTSWMQMGHEILFFWMARMILMTTYTLDEIPFKEVYIHGMLRDKEGKKFSKSAGNGIDPLDVIKEYGTDALRWSLLEGVTPGNDSRFYTEKVESAKFLVNKLWNISRFILMNIEEPKKDIKRPEPKTLADEWILGSLDALNAEVTKLFGEYHFSLAAEKLREFTWSNLADWYLEIAKVEGNKSEMLNYLLNTVLTLWHPFTPFVTEAIWKEVYGEEEFLIVNKWPKLAEVSENNDFETLRSIIGGLRTLRAEYNIEPGKKVVAFAQGEERTQKLIKENEATIVALARLESISYQKSESKSLVGFVESGTEIFIDLSGSVDSEKEIARIEKEIAGVSPYVTSMEKKLSNKGFVDNAPVEVIEVEKKKLEEAKTKLEKLEKQLAMFKA